MSGWRGRLNTALNLLRENELKVRFLVAGGMNTVFGLVIFPVLLLLLEPRGVHYMVVFVICQVLAITFAYATHKFYVFRTYGNYLSEYVKFATYYVGYFIAILISLPFLVEVLHIHPIIAQFILSVAVIITSYFWHSRITFLPRELDQ